MRLIPYILYVQIGIQYRGLFYVHVTV